MPTITITIYIDAGAAVRAGRNRCGPEPLRLSEADIASLTDEQRDTLARHFDGEPGPNSDGPHWGDPIAMHAPPVSTATVETLRVLLDQRRLVMLATRQRWGRFLPHTSAEGEGA